jgi:hypothetical protein
MNKTKTNPQAEPKAPSHIIYQVREREGEKSIWTPLGAAWEHADGKGFGVQLHAIPTEGRIVMRTPSEPKE